MVKFSANTLDTRLSLFMSLNERRPFFRRFVDVHSMLRSGVSWSLRPKGAVVLRPGTPDGSLVTMISGTGNTELSIWGGEGCAGTEPSRETVRTSFARRPISVSIQRSSLLCAC